MCKTIGEYAFRVWLQRCTPTSSRLGFGNGRECALLEVQYGFRNGRGCSDAILVLRRVIDQHLVRRRPLHINFIDITKAYDSIDRETAWKGLLHRGAPPKIVQLLRDMHTDTRYVVRAPGLGLGETFAVEPGFKPRDLSHPCCLTYIWIVSSGISCLPSSPWGLRLGTPSMVLCTNLTSKYEGRKSYYGSYYMQMTLLFCQMTQRNCGIW
jgi:hypothetical protein